MSISMEEAHLVVCPICGESYDPGMDVCPYCGGQDYEDELEGWEEEDFEGASSD